MARVLKVPENIATAQSDTELVLPCPGAKHQVKTNDRVSGTHRRWFQIKVRSSSSRGAAQQSSTPYRARFVSLIRFPGTFPPAPSARQPGSAACHW